MLDDLIDPRAYLERLIVDNTCEVCGETFGQTTVYEEKQPVRYAPIVKRVWMTYVTKKGGYKLKHAKWWKLCPSCMTKGNEREDLLGFARMIFPIIKTMATQPDLIDQLIPVQPMNAPDAGIMYMDFVHGDRVRARARERRNDAADAVAGALFAYQMKNPKAPRTWRAFAQKLRTDDVRGRRAEGIMIDDANWRLDAVKVEGDQLVVDASFIPPETAENIKIDFTVKEDGAHFNDTGEPN